MPSFLSGQEVTAPILNAALDRMGCALRRVANQTLPDNSSTLVAWDTEDGDTHGLFAPTSANITVPAGGGGIWVITFAVNVPVATSGISLSSPRVNGTNIAEFGFLPNTGATGGTAMRPLVAGDVITVNVSADTTSGTTMTASFNAYRVAV